MQWLPESPRFFFDETTRATMRSGWEGEPKIGIEPNSFSLIRRAIAFRAFDFGVRLLAQFTLPALHVFLELGGFGLKDLHELTLGHGSLVVLLYTGQCFVELALFFLQNLLD